MQETYQPKIDQIYRCAVPKIIVCDLFSEADKIFGLYVLKNRLLSNN